MKRAIVTGAAGVIGRSACQRLLRDDYQVVGVDRDKDAGDRLAKEYDAGDRFWFVPADVTSEHDVERYVTVAKDQLGGIDAFFNNAGVEGSVNPIAQYPTDSFDDVIAVNVRGVFLGLKYVMQAMASSGGAIVNTSSVAGLVGVGGISAYVASKHAVIGLTKTAAIEGAPFGIRVNAVSPGPIESRMMSSLQDQAATMLSLPNSAGVRASFTEKIPGGRYGTAEEVAEVVAYLLSPAASYMSGATIPVDFAFTAQ
jgi:NAD(P)-dependent dehydrogenase (short-subunit alcohol dehydrogenase family)